MTLAWPERPCYGALSLSLEYMKALMLLSPLRRLLVIVPLAWFSGPVGFAVADDYPPTVSLEEIQQRIDDCAPAHPRLFATGEQLAGLREAADADPLLQDLADVVIAQADALHGRPPVERVMTGKRLLHVSRECASRVLTLATAFHLTGNARHAERCQEEMLAAARFDDWNPSHFLDVAEMTLALAIGYDWLFDQLDPQARDEIRSAIVEKGVALQFNSPHTGWRRSTNNWAQVCHGGLTAGALAVLEDKGELAARTVHSAVHNVVPAMNHYAPHGGYPEGPGYWNYGTSFNVFLIAALESALQSDFGLTAAPGFEETGGYPALVTGPSGLPYNYSDGNASRGGQPVLYWFAKRFDRPDWLRGERERIADAIAAGNRSGGGGLGFLPLVLLWAPQAPAADGAPVQLPLQWNSGGETPVSVHRSGWGDDATFVGIKGGSPSDSHGQMDVGSFVLDAEGVRWAHELGREGYHAIESRGMNLWSRAQDSDRWTIFRLSNFSHNTLVIGGQLQRADGRAPLVQFEASGTPHTILDLSDVYRGQAASARRLVAMFPGGGVLIQDELTGLKTDSTVRWAIATRAKPGVLGGRAVALKQRGKQLTLTARAPEDAAWHSVDVSQPEHEWDSPNRNTRMMVLESKPKSDGRLTIAVIATPGASETDGVAPLEIQPLANWLRD